jgi:Bacterial RNA polymerase, alpha chain C terminal domain
MSPKTVNIDGTIIRHTITSKGCWLSAKLRNSKEGTPYILKKGKKTYPQTVLWQKANPGITPPAGTRIKETCGNKGCLNPEHLKPLTHSEIILARGKHKSGSANGRALLTEEQVAIIKNSLQYSNTRLAEAFHVTVGAIQDIRNGRNWKHVQPAENTPSLFLDDFVPEKIPGRRPESEKAKTLRLEKEAKALKKEQDELLDRKRRSGWYNPEDLLARGNITDAQFLSNLDRGEKERQEENWERIPPSQLGPLEKLNREKKTHRIYQTTVELIFPIYTALYGEYDDWSKKLRKTAKTSGRIPVLGSLIEELIQIDNLEKAQEAWSTWLQTDIKDKQDKIREAIFEAIEESKKQLQQRSQKTAGSLPKGIEDKVYEINLHYSAYNALDDAKTKKISELTNFSPRHLFYLNGIGEKTRAEITCQLAEWGLQLRMQPTPFELLTRRSKSWKKEQRQSIANAFLRSSIDQFQSHILYDPTWNSEHIRKGYNLKAKEFTGMRAGHWLSHREREEKNFLEEDQEIKVRYHTTEFWMLHEGGPLIKLKYYHTWSCSSEEKLNEKIEKRDVNHLKDLFGPITPIFHDDDKKELLGIQFQELSPERISRLVSTVNRLIKSKDFHVKPHYWINPAGLEKEDETQWEKRELPTFEIPKSEG